MEKISGNFPRIISGHSIEVGGEKYDSVRKLAEGGFAKVYVGKHQGQLEAFKVSKNIYISVLYMRCVCVCLCVHQVVATKLSVLVSRFKVHPWSGSWQ